MCTNFSGDFNAVLKNPLLKDIRSIERVQRRSTKFILNDYASGYKSRLISTNLVSLSLWFEFMDTMYLINCFKYPEEHFNIFSFEKFTTNRTRPSSNCKLKCILPLSSNNHLILFFLSCSEIMEYFPIIDLHLSINIPKTQSTHFLLEPLHWWSF